MQNDDNVDLILKVVDSETEEVLKEVSFSSNKSLGLALLTVAKELAGARGRKPRKPKEPKPTLQDKRKKNIDSGRPAMSHISWHDVDEARLQYGFEVGRSIPDMAMMLERSVHAIIGHLKTLELISEDEATAYLEKYPKDAQSD